MKPIDSVLRLLVQQGGTELRFVSNQPPRMFQETTELPLTMPAMSTASIQGLLDDLWTDNAAVLRARHRATATYQSSELGAFALHLSHGEDDVLRATLRVAATAAAPPVAASSPSHGAAAPDTAALPEALSQLLRLVARRGASDLHLSPQRAPVMRVDGSLAIVESPQPVDVAVLLAGAAQREIIQRGGSVDRAVEVAGVGRVRINVYRSDEGLCAALRILRREAPALAELGLPSQIANLAELPHGLIVACGPTGAGKSTTLAALAQHAMQARARVLVTLEDPIEYIIQPMHAAGLVRQREIGTHVGAFGTGLRDALREDPDLLLVGEMRDAETISLALTAAETGHLVFASLHSRTAMSAVERIVDTYPPERQRQIRVQLADALRAVIAQRLLPRADGGGRLAAVELLRVTYGVANLIREGRTAQIVNALQAGSGDGMLQLERHLADLVRAKRITRDIAVATANDPGTLADYLRGA